MTIAGEVEATSPCTISGVGGGTKPIIFAAGSEGRATYGDVRFYGLIANHGTISNDAGDIYLMFADIDVGSSGTWEAKGSSAEVRFWNTTPPGQTFKVGGGKMIVSDGTFRACRDLDFYGGSKMTGGKIAVTAAMTVKFMGHYVE